MKRALGSLLAPALVTAAVVAIGLGWLVLTALSEAVFHPKEPRR